MSDDPAHGAATVTRQVRFPALCRTIDNARILVIGGAGFLGSHIVDQLLDEPVAKIVVLDNFVRGTRANLEEAASDDRASRSSRASITDRRAARTR